MFHATKIYCASDFRKEKKRKISVYRKIKNDLKKNGELYLTIFIIAGVGLFLTRSFVGI